MAQCPPNADSSGNVNEHSSRNCSVAEYFPEKLRWSWNEQVCQGVKHFERSYGLDTALYKNVPFTPGVFGLGLCHSVYTCIYSVLL